MRGWLCAADAGRQCAPVLLGPVVRPLNFTVRHRQDMRYLRAFTLVGALALAVMPALAIDLHDYTAVKLHRGINDVDLGATGQRTTRHSRCWTQSELERA